MLENFFNVLKIPMTLISQSCSFLGDETFFRTFLYDILFFQNSRCHVVINVILDTWPEILWQIPNNNSGINMDPVLETAIWMIYNTGPASSLTDMKVHEARNKLYQFCGQRKPKTTADELIKNFIKLVEERHRYVHFLQIFFPEYS